MTDRKLGNTVGITFDPAPYVRRLTPQQLDAIAAWHIVPADAVFPGIGVEIREKRGRAGRVRLHQFVRPNLPILVRLAQLAERAERRVIRQIKKRKFCEWAAQQRIDYEDETAGHLKRRARNQKLWPPPHVAIKGAPGAAARLQTWGVLTGDRMPSDPVLARWRHGWGSRRLIDCAILDSAIELGFVARPPNFHGWMAEFFS